MCIISASIHLYVFLEVNANNISVRDVCIRSRICLFVTQWSVTLSMNQRVLGLTPGSGRQHTVHLIVYHPVLACRSMGESYERMLYVVTQMAQFSLA